MMIIRRRLQRTAVGPFDFLDRQRLDKCNSQYR